MAQRCALAGSSCWGPVPDSTRYIIALLLRRETSPAYNVILTAPSSRDIFVNAGKPLEPLSWKLRTSLLCSSQTPAARPHWGQIASLGLAVMDNAVTICSFNFRLRNLDPVSLCHFPMVEVENETSTRAADAYSPTLPF